MQDIRAGLKERLAAVIKERSALRARFAEIEQLEATIRVLLQQEESKFGKLEPKLPFNELAPSAEPKVVRGNTPLSRLIIATLETSNKPLTLSDFKQEAARRNFDFGDKAPGRVLLWALVGME